MKPGFLNQHFKNVRWIQRSVKAFMRSLVIIIVINAVSSLSGVVIAITSKNIIDSATSQNISQALQYGILFAFIIIFNLVSSAFISVYSTVTLEKYANQLRQKILSKLLNVEWLQVSKYHSGDLLTRLTSDIASVANGAISVIPQLIALGVQLFAAFFTLLYYEPRLAVLAFFLAPFTIILSRQYGKKLKKLYLKIQESEGEYRSHIQESIQNLLVLKTFNLEERSVEKVDLLQKERLHWVRQRAKTGMIANTILSSGYWVGYLLALGWGALNLSRKLSSFGTLTAFLQLVNQIQSPFIGLSRTLPQIIAALASAGRLMELEKMSAEADAEWLKVPDVAGLQFDNVHFSYEKKDIVLDGISMTVPPGAMVALVGPSGEGKTTIIRLMLALLKPDRGQVSCVDPSGVIFPITSAYRRWFSYVPQGNTLFSGTIADNVRSGKLDATKEEVLEALDAACVLEAVMKLPDGVDTAIGEKAYGLSEGQAQRISIARALLRDAPILILDEATSALDMDLEDAVLRGIRHSYPDRTCIMITHRRNALGMCSSIYRIKEGLLVME